MPDGEPAEPPRAEGRTGFELRELKRGAKPGTRYLRLMVSQDQPLRRQRPGYLQATEAAGRPRAGLRLLLNTLKRSLIGPPLASAALVHQRISKIKALAVFSSDALSSSAYATEEILLILVLAGTVALDWSIWIALAIVALMTVVSISYRQTIRAYPNGGGAYIVAHENLGQMPGLVAGASLMIDYVLTVAVSIAAGVAAVTSAVPDLRGEEVPIAVAFVAFITTVNLRGIRESATVFAIPTYLFIVAFLSLIVVGAVRLALGHDTSVAAEEEIVATQGIGLWLVLRAFAGGSTALTGIEAISNGVPAFKPPESRNARTTLAWMAAILATLFLGITVLAREHGITPVEGETVVSQLARGVFEGGFFYYVIQAVTALILILAANTAYADFPRLSSILARDRYVPRMFAFRGDRLAFSNGIIALGLLAVFLLFIFDADVHRLIPLYAVGVFISFTLSQSGMVVHWNRLREPGWRRSLLINGFGAVCTCIVAVVIASTKFTHGAWIVLLLIPVFVWLFKSIHDHYVQVERELAVEDLPAALPRINPQHEVVVPISGLDRSVIRTLAYAKAHSRRVTAVHLTDDPEEGERLRDRWEELDPGIPLVVIESPYRSFTAPLLAYIDSIDRSDPGRPVTVVLPEFIPRRWWQTPLHNQSALRLKAALLFRPNVVVVDVPFHLAGRSVAGVAQGGDGRVERGDVDLEGLGGEDEARE